MTTPATPADLHARIMSIPCVSTYSSTQQGSAYIHGHDDARHAAAELVSEHLAAVPQQPVAWLSGKYFRLDAPHDDPDDVEWESLDWMPLYASPPLAARPVGAMSLSDEQIVNIARQWDATEGPAFDYRGMLSFARAVLSASAPAVPQAAGDVMAELHAKRWRTLMNLPGAGRRIWNHVLDDEQKGRHGSIEEALDALDRAAAKGQK